MRREQASALRSKQRHYPINKTVYRAREGAVEDDGTCDGKDFCAETQDKPLCLWSSRTHYVLLKSSLTSAMFYQRADIA